MESGVTEVNLEAEVTVIEAAAWFKVSPKTVRTWVARYSIASVGGRAKNTKTYRFSDLVAADRRARGHG